MLLLILTYGNNYFDVILGWLLEWTLLMYFFLLNWLKELDKIEWAFLPEMIWGCCLHIHGWVEYWERELGDFKEAVLLGE